MSRSAAASRRSRRMVLRRPDDRTARKSSKLAERGHGRHRAVVVLDGQMLRRPSGALAHATGLFEDIEKVISHERVDLAAGSGRAAVPVCGPDFGDPAMNPDGGLEARHAAKPSKIRLSQWVLIPSHSAALRTDPATTGIPLRRSFVALGLGSMSRPRARKCGLAIETCSSAA